MSAESPRHARAGGPLTVPSQPPSDRGLIDAVSGFINDVTLSASSALDPKDVIQWARFETADINEPAPSGESDGDLSPLLLILGYGAGVQVWLVPPSGEAQEVLSWRQGTVRVLRILPSPQHGDCFASKRPLIALCDSASPGPTFCSLSFISIRGGEQVKRINFKNPILDVLANKRSVVVAFSERFAVFDAGTLEDRIAITTCYPCPCPLGGAQPVNPLALGDRWLAYADKKLHPSKRSSGGCEGEGVTSYTATVLHAAKSLSKGLRGLGESVAHSLAGGGRSTSQSPSPPNSDSQQAGVVTILDIEGTEYDDEQESEDPYDPIVAHFLAHSEAIIALKFDASGMLLVTADRRGHDFHVFRVNPHPCGPSLASVHHLYILHRGDTTAKVQDIAISSDSRWTAITTLRGTTHVFAISPYGGACGVRTHTQPRVVNRLSRFHRSAGLPIHATAPPRSGSPVGEAGQGAWFPNPRLPPYPLPCVCAPLAQLRPTANLPTHTITRTSSGRQRLSSLSEECNSAPLPARARFGLSLASGAAPRAPAHPALYLLTHTGSLLQLLLHARPARSVPKEKVCDESPIEVEVEPVAQWALARPAPPAPDLLAPLPPASPLLQPATGKLSCPDMCMSEEERWLSQVEIVTHAGPHRRLWMGPQFVFKTYNTTGSNSSLSEAEAVEVDTSAAGGVARSNPVNMPGVRPVVPVLIDSGSASSLEHSPSDSFRRKSLLADSGRAASVCDVQLREDLAEAMKEDQGWPAAGPARPVRHGPARAVDPAGTVVRGEPDRTPRPGDPDRHTRPNCDEATFRPVVRAPAALALRPAEMARPLPRATTIPAQAAGPLAPPSPAEPRALTSDVVIPARLSDFTPVDPRPENERVSADEWCSGPERASVSLPKSNRSDDIQPIARARVKKSPTRVSDRDRVSVKRSEEIEGAIVEPKLSEAEPEVVVDDKLSVVDVEVEPVPGAPVVNLAEETREKCTTTDILKANLEDLREKSEKSYKTEIVKADVEDARDVSKKKIEVEKPVLEESRGKSKKVEKSDTLGSEKEEKREKSKKNEKPDTVKTVVEETHYRLKKSVTPEIVKIVTEETREKSNIPTKPDTVKIVTEETREKSKKLQTAKVVFEEPRDKSKKLETARTVFEEPREKSKKFEKPETAKVVIEEPRDKPKKLETAKTVFEEPREKSKKFEKPETAKVEIEEPRDKPKKLETAKTVFEEPREKSKKFEKPETAKVVIEEPRDKPKKLETAKTVFEEPREKSKKFEKPETAKVEIEEPRDKPKKLETAKRVFDEPYEKSMKLEKSETTKVVIEEPCEKLKKPEKNEIVKTVTDETRETLKKYLKPETVKTVSEEIRDKPKRVEKPEIVATVVEETRENTKKIETVEIFNAEEQAWDLLLNEPEKPAVLNVTQQTVVMDKCEEKPKSKKNRKSKKGQEDLVAKDDDSFIEIHAIEEAKTPSCGELVSISTPFEDIDATSSYLSKVKKQRSIKCFTPERSEEFDVKPIEMLPDDDYELTLVKMKTVRKNSSVSAFIEGWPEPSPIKRAAPISIEKPAVDNLRVKHDISTSEIASTSPKDAPKSKKSKSLSPYSEANRKHAAFEPEKDVYVIDSTKDEFPEIQITRGTKNRKKSPQPAERKSVDKEVIQPIKSWSSIAAAKSEKKGETSTAIQKYERIVSWEDRDVGTSLGYPKSSNDRVSLQDKLIELCKRTDIMVAECDAPTGLNFVDEHHTDLQDLPPLEPLDFGLDDYKLEVMRDSLLEASDAKLSSPICKINIDDILSSIKETTSKVIESSAFNLVDLEKIPARKEKGFSVVESHKITTQEVKVEDEGKDDGSVMDKSSDDDNASPPASTDSDKEDKRAAGVANVLLPSAKQAAKSKKPRRKKK